MAMIETPEVDQQLQVAEADLKSAQANSRLANTTAARYQNLLKTNSVSKQETDSGHQRRRRQTGRRRRRRWPTCAACSSCSPSRSIYAPFDGVVTARNTDIGELIDAGSGSAQPKELFHLAAIDKLRVFVAVPEVYARDIHDGGTATLTLDEYPGQQFERHASRATPT